MCPTLSKNVVIYTAISRISLPTDSKYCHFALRGEGVVAEGIETTPLK
jgi:hypothetical protein